MHPKVSNTELIARMYYEASRSGVAMKEFVPLTEEMKLLLLAKPEPLAQWTIWDDWIIRSKENTFLAMVLQARIDFVRALTQSYAAQISSKEKTILEVFYEYLKVWRTIHMKAVFSELKHQGERVEDEEYWLQLIQIIEERRWVEMLPYLETWLANDFKDSDDQAHLKSVIAAIYIFYVGEYDRSRVLLDEALALNNQQPYALSVDASWYLEQRRMEEAKERYQRMVLEPSLQVIGLNGLGNCFRKQEDFFTAEDWYVKALQVAPGYLETYQNLIALYGSEGRLYAQRKDKIQAYVDFELLIEPMYSVQYYLDASYACAAANDIPLAQQWLDRGLAIDQNRFDLMLQQGNLYKLALPADISEQLNSALYHKTIASFNEAITKVPNCFDAWWALYVLYKQTEQYEFALNTLTQVYPKATVFKELCVIEMTDCYEKLQQWPKASAALLQGIEAHPESTLLFEHAESYAERLAEQDSLNQQGFTWSESFYHALCNIVPEQRKLAFYQFFTKSISKRKQDEDFLIRVYEDAMHDFPEEKQFQQQLNRLQVLRTMYRGKTAYSQYTTDIAVECDALLCNLFLTPERNEFTSGFWQKLNQFKEQFNQRFGVQLPAIIFREYQFHSDEYSFFSTLDEVYTTYGVRVYNDCLLVRGNIGTMSVVDTCKAYEPWITLHWIKPDQLDQVPASCVVLEPVDIIFEHLQFTLWSQLYRYIRYDHILAFSEVRNLSLLSRTRFMLWLQTLAQYKVALQDIATLVHYFQQGEQQQSLQESALMLLHTHTFTFVPPYDNHAAPSLFILDEDQERHLTSLLLQTKNRQWAIDLDVETCQNVLEAVRNKDNLRGRCIVQTIQGVWILNSLCNIEFPYFQFGTKAMFELSDDQVDKAIKITW